MTHDEAIIRIENAIDKAMIKGFVNTAKSLRELLETFEGESGSR